MLNLLLLVYLIGMIFIAILVLIGLIFSDECNVYLHYEGGLIYLIVGILLWPIVIILLIVEFLLEIIKFD